MEKISLPRLSLAILSLLALAPTLICCAPGGEGLTLEERKLVRSGDGPMRVLKSDSPQDAETLRLFSRDVTDAMLDSKDFALLCERMLQTVRDPENDGVGIAAPQVGIPIQLIAVMRFDKEDRPFEFIVNPRILEFSENRVPTSEGCLSVSGLHGVVERPSEIEVSYRTLSGRDTVETVSDYTAVIFQHEIDHLEGTLYTDRAVILGNDHYQTRTLHNGSKVTWIQDNAKPRLMPLSLFPDATEEMLEDWSSSEGIPSSVSVFLLERQDGKALFDAGNGSPDSRLLGTLEELGVEPEEIGDIFLTHLHGDHIGGLLSGSERVFPNAKVWVSKDEMDWWMGLPEDRNASQRALAEVYGGQLRLFGPGEELPCEVRAIPAAGHTPGHTVYCTSDLLVVGDIIHALDLQLPNPEVCAVFDEDKKGAVDRRRWLMEHAQREGLLIAGMHFPAPAFF